MAGDTFDFEGFIKKEGIVVKDKLTLQEKEEIAKSILERDLKGNKNPTPGDLVSLKAAVEGAIRRAEDALLGVSSSKGAKAPKASKEAKPALDEAKKAGYIKEAVKFTDSKARETWINANVLPEYRRAVKRNATIQLAGK